MKMHTTIVLAAAAILASHGSDADTVALSRLVVPAADASVFEVDSTRAGSSIPSMTGHPRAASTIPRQTGGSVAFSDRASVRDVQGVASTGEGIAARISDVSVPFVENRGQVSDPAVKYYAQLIGGKLLVEEQGRLTYDLGLAAGRRALLHESFSERSLEPAGAALSATRVSYFRGRDPDGWHTNLATYEAISYGAISEGVSLVLKAHHGNVEKIFTLAPGADLESIAVRVEGIQGMKVRPTGELEVRTPQGPVAFTRPVAYQDVDGERREVDAKYVLLADKAYAYGFEVGGYDAKRPLIIDPLLASSYIGSYSYDYGLAIAVDAAGDVYIAGGSRRDSLGRYYPTTSGVYQEADADDDDDYDVIVSKLDSGLTTLLASTFIGGVEYDVANAMEVDPGVGAGGSESLVIVGLTSSTDFPATAGAYDEDYNGSSDVFVLRMSTDLVSLEASTYVGGSHYEFAFETNMDRGPSMAIDAAGNIYVAGTTASSDFPTTPTDAGYGYTAFQDSKHGDDEAYVFKLSPDLSALLAGTYLGGSKNERGTGVALDASGHVFVTGHTESTDGEHWPMTYRFPTTLGAYDRTYNSDGGVLHEDGFVSRFDGNLETLEASTFIGGDSFEWYWAIAVDPADGSVYVGGVTQSSDYPTTPGAYDETSNSGYDGFISKLDNDLTTLVAGTRLGGGGGGSNYIYALEVDPDGNLWATGYTSSDEFPNLEDPDDPNWSTYSNPSYFSSKDVFLSQLDADLTELLRSVHMSGSYDQQIWDMVVHFDGYYAPGEDVPTIPEDEPTVHVVGRAESGGTTANGYYTTPGAYDRVAHNGDVLITIFGYVPEPTPGSMQAAALMVLGALTARRSSSRRRGRASRRVATRIR
jgi:hypothetical protein